MSDQASEEMAQLMEVAGYVRRRMYQARRHERGQRMETSLFGDSEENEQQIAMVEASSSMDAFSHLPPAPPRVPPPLLCATSKKKPEFGDARSGRTCLSPC